jgi:uncharacterized protein YjbI with pentapeptide repeats
MNAILGRASLVETNLSGAFLQNANLNGANLNRADLRDAWLVSTSLTGKGFEVPDEASYDLLKERLNSGANLEGADLSGANLEGADLSGAYLKDAKVSLEQLKKAESLEGATMIEGSVHHMANQEHLATLKQGAHAWNLWRKARLDLQPDLRRADLNFADLSGADLSGADLSGADLSGADLSDAKVTEEQLKKARSLLDVTMPYEEYK